MSAIGNDQSSITDPNPHILVFPYPAQGHMLPLLDLTHQLCLHKVSVTILTTPKNLPLLSPLLSAHPTITPLVLPFPSHPSLPAGVENVKDIGNGGNLPIMSALGKLRDPIIQWFQSHPNPPVAILSDFFLGWTVHLARCLNIPRFAFFTSGAFLASVVDYCWNHAEQVRSMDPFEFTDLPRSPVIKEDHLPSTFRRYRESDPDCRFAKDVMIANGFSYGCVFNSFDDLEGEYLSYFKRKMGHERIFGVGPLSLIGLDSSSRGNADSGSDLDSHVLTWLDGCPDGSVLYVCFGSQKTLTREQIEALAVGLEKSMTRFVWVVKTGTAGHSLVPDGFEERLQGRGLVVRGWAPQVSVLNHRAVGGFLSHCGWNSTLEGIVGGALILAWPMEADQFVNAKLVAEDMGVAVWVCDGGDAVPDPEKLSRLIAESMAADGRVKERAKQLREKGAAAVKSGGSSLRDLDKLVKELRQLQV